jgi:two-component system, NarL family, invasion response regulator UvrY
MNPPLQTVLLVDDHSVVRTGLRLLLEGSGQYKCLEAGTAEEAMQFIMIHSEIKVILLDLNMPQASGLDILPHITRLKPNLAIIVLSMHGEEQYALRCMRLGAKSYLNKSAPSQEILKAVELACQGISVVPQKIISRMAIEVSSDKSPAPLHEALSNQEFKILKLLGQGKSVTEISKDLSINIKSVSTYRERLFRKMNFTKNMDAISYVVREGLYD